MKIIFFNLFFQAKLKVGDMMLAVNTESFLDITYDEVIYDCNYDKASFF